MSDYNEFQNLVKLYDLIKKKQYPLNYKERLKEFNQIVMSRFDLASLPQCRLQIANGFVDRGKILPGNFRIEYVGYTAMSNEIIEFIIPCAVDVEELINLFFKHFDKLLLQLESDEDIWLLAAYVQFHLSVLHPFPIGNGRAARAFAASIIYEKLNHLFFDKFKTEQKGELQKAAFYEIERLLKQTDIYDERLYESGLNCFKFERNNFKDLTYLNRYFTKLRDLLRDTYLETDLNNVRSNENFKSIASILKKLPALQL